jgi:hypothetical protein
MGEFLDVVAVACAGFVLCHAVLCGVAAWRRAGAVLLLVMAVAFGRGALLPWLGAGVAVAAVYCCKVLRHRCGLWSHKKN